MNASASDTRGARSTRPGQAATHYSRANETVQRPACGWIPSQLKVEMSNELTEEGTAPQKGTSRLSKASARAARPVREYSAGEEVANSVSHGVGIVLAMVALVLLVMRAIDDGSGIYLFVAVVYGATMLLEYTMSTLYHAISHEGAKKIFKILDHSCIYLFIAGSYTPFCLISLADTGGVWLCAFVWGVALIGVACEAFWVFRPRWLSALLYLLLGWSVIAFLPQLIEAIPGPGLWLLVGGGVCYSLGCIFYVLKKIPYMHSIFHLWVLAGSILQFLAILLYVM